MPEHPSTEDEPRRKRWKLVDLALSRIDRVPTGGGDNPGARILLAKSRDPAPVPDGSEPFGKRVARLPSAERRQLNAARVKAAIQELIDLGVDPTEAAKVVLGRRDGTRALSDFVSAPGAPAKKESPMSSNDVYQKIQKAAETIRKDNPDLTVEQAELRAVEDNPGLADEYREAKKAEPVLTGEPPVEKSAKGESFRDRVSALVEERVQQLHNEHGIEKVRGYEIALAEPGLRECYWWASQPAASQPVAKACADLLHADMPPDIARRVM